MSVLDVFRRRPPVQVITGSAARMGDDRAGAAGRPPKRPAWQKEAWAFYDAIGEVHYSCNFVSACFSRVVLRPGWKGEDDRIGPVFDDKGAVLPGIPAEAAVAAADLLRRLKHPLGGQPRLMSAIGLNLAITGEFWLLGTDVMDGGTVLDSSWEALSVEELVAKPEQRRDAAGRERTVFERRRSEATAQGMGEELPLDSYLVRCWQAHPRFSLQADSMLRPVLDVCEELLLLTRAVRALATSRLAGAGILLIPNEIAPPKRQTPDVEDTKGDWFVNDLLTSMMTPIGDKESASAIVPYVLRAEAKYLTPEVLRHIDFTRDFDSYPSVALRKEAVDRFAQGVDLPVEVVTGHKQTTFANAEAIDRATFKVHIEPKLELVTDALTVGYLHPGLRVALGVGEGPLDPEVSRLTVWYDETELVTPPDREQAAIAGYDRMEISGSALRSALAFSENDAPDDEEIERRLEWKSAGAPSTAPADPGSPEPAPDELGPANSMHQDLLLRLTAAAELAVDRAVDRAGARLRSKLNGRSRLPEGVPNNELAARLGLDAVAAICSVDDLLAGEFATFERTVAQWSQQQGLTHPGRCAEAMRALVEAATRERLFDPWAQLPLAGVVLSVDAGSNGRP